MRSISSWVLLSSLNRSLRLGSSSSRVLPSCLRFLFSSPSLRFISAMRWLNRSRSIFSSSSFSSNSPTSLRSVMRSLCIPMKFESFGISTSTGFISTGGLRRFFRAMTAPTKPANRSSEAMGRTKGMMEAGGRSTTISGLSDGSRAPYFKLYVSPSGCVTMVERSLT